MPKKKKNEDEEESPLNEKLKKAYELTFQDTKSKFIVIVSKRKKTNLRIKIIDDSKFHLTYMSEFSYDELLKINKFFWLFKDIDSIIYELDNLFLDEKVMLSLDLEHNIVMKFLTELNSRNSFVLLKIENQDAEKMKEMGKIMALVEQQKGIINDLNKENRQLKKQIEKNGYHINTNDEEEDEEGNKSSNAKGKTSNSFLPQNGSLYDKKLVKPKIDRTEIEEKKENKEENDKKEEKKENPEEKLKDKKEEDKNKEIKEEEKKNEENKNEENENKEEEELIKEDKKEKELEEEKEEEIKIDDKKEKDIKSESKKEEKEESEISLAQRRERSKRPVRENKLNIQLELSKITKKSRIFKEEREVAFLIDKINQNLNYRNKKFYFMRLIYRASDDGDTPYKFHRLCDGLSPLIVLIKTTYNKRFGGFTEAYYEASDELIGKRSNTAFLFNLDKEKAFDIIEGQNAICCHKNYGPVFYGFEYCNIYLVGNFLINEGNVARKGDRFKTTMDYEINDGRQKFVASEVEVYHITLTNA